MTERKDTERRTDGRRGIRCRDIAYSLIQCTWGMAQSFAGLVLFLICRARHCASRYSLGVISVYWNRRDGISLGLFTFSPPDGVLAPHEYGHTVQSAILGPLYIPAVLLPSLLWCGLPFFRRLRQKKKIPYSALYCERWADREGAKRWES